MSKHTEGPWTLTHKAGTNFAVQRFEIRGRFGETENIYPIFQKDIYAIDGTTVCCSPEDARLIAAAPKMLAALKSAFKIPRPWIAGSQPLTEEEWGAAVDAIAAAIRKAEGKA